MKKITAIIVAAGEGHRVLESEANLKTSLPKQYHDLGGKAVLNHSLSLFSNHPLINEIIVVIGATHEPLFKQYCPDFLYLKRVIGGKTRQQSVFAALQALSKNPPDYVLIHDAARPFISDGLVDRLLANLLANGAVVPACPVVDSLKYISAENGKLTQSVPRNQLMRVQTPQAFPFIEIFEAHQAMVDDPTAEDDAFLLQKAGHDVATITGEEQNYKLTTAEDFMRAHAEITQATKITIHPAYLIGYGFDLHRLVEREANDPIDGVRLCGLCLDQTFKLAGHSDADCALHALTDALLGLIGDGDIGDHFPPTDPKWANKDSSHFLHHALEKINQSNLQLMQISLTILAEYPKIAPYRKAMVNNLMHLTGLQADKISIKATTMEGVDAIGNKQAIACHAHILAMNIK